MDLYLIRHAQSANNALTDIRLRTMDPLLTELGVRQAELVAGHLARIIPTGHSLPTRLYCSPMWRALHTASFIARTTGLTPQVWVEVHEHGGIYLDHGEEAGVIGYPGKTRQEMLTEFPGVILPPEVTDQGWWHGGREELSACYERAARVIEALSERIPTDERILIVSHGGFINSFLKLLFDQQLDWPVFYHHANTAITYLTLTAERHVDVHYLNRVDHLTPEMVS
jgi:2,3-bisphosphoglycerate-dependent phosphoglycerate mutase